MVHYTCWSFFFVESCLLLLHLSIFMQDLENANLKLAQFCKSFETLFRKKKNALLKSISLAHEMINSKVWASTEFLVFSIENIQRSTRHLILILFFMDFT